MPLCLCHYDYGGSAHRSRRVAFDFFVDRYIGQTVLCVGNIHQTIVDCFELEAFREYRDDLRDHMSDSTQETKIRNKNSGIA